MSDPIQGRTAEEWVAYDRMMEKRDPMSFTKPGFCKHCNRLEGNHLTDFALEKNPYACKFESN